MSTVLLVDDHALFRQSLARIITHEPEFTVTAQAGSLAEARTHLTHVDIALIDLGLPDGDGVDLIAELRVHNPPVLVVILTASVDQMDYARAIESGAAGVLHKSSSIEELIESLHRLLANRWLFTQKEIIDLLRFADHQRAQSRTAQALPTRLTPRERDVLAALAHGLSSKEIAQRLNITSETERSHMVNILAKVGAHSRLHALVLAVRHGLIDVPSTRSR